jgi:hypothetical protein
MAIKEEDFFAARTAILRPITDSAKADGQAAAAIAGINLAIIFL